MTTATAPGRISTSPGELTPTQPARRRRMKSPYPTWFFIPAGVFYVVLFLVPTVASFYFSLTRWTLFESSSSASTTSCGSSRNRSS